MCVVNYAVQDRISNGGLNDIPGISSAVGAFLAHPDRDDNGGSTNPKAYVNWILFDDNFKMIDDGFERVNANGGILDHPFPDIMVPNNGYIYVYVSNESPVPVYFDNLQVIHSKDHILEETHYYPFGLIMAGVSSKAAGATENKKKYQQYEFNSDFDLNLYESFYRSHDPQLGRFWQIDPKSEMLEQYTPYESMGNNPAYNVDPLGDFKTWFGAFWYSLGHGGKVGKNEFGEWYVLKTSATTTEDGTVVVTANLSYGNGRFRDLAQREQWLKDFKSQERNDHLVRKGVYERVYPEEAKERTISVAAGVLLPNLLKFGTISVNSANAAKGVNGLIKAGNVLDRAGLTTVGRHLQKHGSRPGSIFPKATGNAATINAQGEAVLKGILSSPNVTSVSRHHARFGYVLEYKIPGGQGARFSANGKTFLGFIE
jgi:RHS repeat-associated protein